MVKLYLARDILILDNPTLALSQAVFSLTGNFKQSQDVRSTTVEGLIGRSVETWERKNSRDGRE